MTGVQKVSGCGKPDCEKNGGENHNRHEDTSENTCRVDDQVVVVHVGPEPLEHKLSPKAARLAEQKRKRTRKQQTRPIELPGIPVKELVRQPQQACSGQE